MLNILLADDHTLFREGMTLLLTEVLDDCNIQQAISWFETQHFVQTQSCDIALLDLAMPGAKDWQQEVADCLLHVPHLNICIISATYHYATIRTAFDIGVKAYIPKTASKNEIYEAIKQVLRGNIYLPRDSWHSAKQNARQVLGQNTMRITLRQQEILTLVSEGHSNQEIAGKLYLSVGTVKRHMSNIFKTIQVKSRTQAVQVARSHHLL